MKRLVKGVGNLRVRHISLRAKLALIICCISFFAIVASSLAFFFSVKKINEDIVYDNLESLQLAVQDNISSSLSAIDKTAKNIILGSNVRQFLRDGANLAEMDNSGKVLLRQGIEKEISNQMLFNSVLEEGLIESINFYLDEHNIAYFSRDGSLNQKDSPTIRQIYRTIQQNTNANPQIFSSTSYDPYLHFAYRISSLDQSNRSVYLIITINRAGLLAKCQSITDYENSVVYLANQKGTVILSNHQDNEGEALPANIGENCTRGKITHLNFENKAHLYFSQWLNDKSFFLAVMMPEELFVRSLYDAMRDYLFLSIGISLVIMAFIILLSLRMTAFTHDFAEGLQKFGKGDLTVKLPPYRDADLNHISNTFNKMTERINFLVEDGYKKQLLIQEMDIEFLQSQMNPHFLFNTLFTISTRAKMSGDDLLFQMTQSLTKLLQASLHTKNDIKVTVAQELEYINAYLYIQKARYGNKLEYTITTGSPEILTLSIPRLCIQPLVENAVVHGIEPLSATGHIDVVMELKDGTLQITVTDNGVGFDPAEAPDESGSSNQSNHIALQNLQERIRLIYGGAYGITIDSAPGQGCRAIVILPADEGGNHGLSSTDRR